MNYGEFLARALKAILISYKTYGSYQGDWVAVVEKDHDWIIYKGRYGSCSGCDWIQSTRIYSDEDYKRLEDINYEEAYMLEPTFKLKKEIVDEFFGDNKPFLTIPKSQLPDTLEDFKALLPANTRTLQDENWHDVDQDAKMFEQMQHFKLDNLRYLEQLDEK